MLTPNDIANKKFDKTFGYGYRTEEVEEFLEQMAEYTQQMLEDKKDLEKKLEILADKLEEYRQDEDSLRTALLGAQKLGDSVIRESKTKAEIVMRDATIKAETMVDNARRQIEQEQMALAKLQKEVANFKNRLLALYRQHLELISALPGEEEPNPQSPEKPKAKAASPAREETPAARQQTSPQPQPAQPEPVVDSAPSQEPEEEEMEEEFHLNFDDDIREIEDAVESVEQDAVAEVEVAQQQESRFGPLKFGDNFGLKRNDDAPRPKRKW